MNELDKRYAIIEHEFKDYIINYIKKPINFALNGEDGYTEQEVIICITEKGKLFNVIIHESSDFFENCPIEVFNFIIGHKRCLLDDANYSPKYGTRAKDKQFIEQCISNKQFGIEKNYVLIGGYKHSLLNAHAGFVRCNDE